MRRLLAKLLTRSFPGNPDQLIGADVSAPAPTPETSQDSSYESKAFALWMERLLAHGRVLELGCAQGGSINFLLAQEFGLSITNLKVPTDDLEAQLQQYNDDDVFDGVLCWDLPNFLSHEQLDYLGGWLKSHTRPKSVIHLSLATRTPYGNAPASYTIVSPNRLECLHPADANRSDLISGGKLGSLWPGFEFTRSFLLQSGWQEFVLTRT